MFFLVFLQAAPHWVSVCPLFSFKKGAPFSHGLAAGAHHWDGHFGVSQCQSSGHCGEGEDFRILGVNKNTTVAGVGWLVRLCIYLH